MDEIYIQFRFKAKTEYGEYCDAIYFTQEEFDALTEEDLEKQKQARIDLFVKNMSTPVVVQDETEENIEQALIKAEEDLAQIENLKVQLLGKLNLKSQESNPKKG